MDRGYDPRVGSGPDVQEIDSEQLLNLTSRTHGSGGSFFASCSEPEQLFVCTSGASWTSGAGPVVLLIPRVPYDTFSAFSC